MLRFMRWTSIHAGRLCMPLSFTSTGWNQAWRLLGKGPRPMLNSQSFVLYFMGWKKHFHHSSTVTCLIKQDYQHIQSPLLINTIKPFCSPKYTFLFFFTVFLLFQTAPLPLLHDSELPPEVYLVKQSLINELNLAWVIDFMIWFEAAMPSM